MAQLGDGDLERWRDLSDRALYPNPFFDPDYLRPLASTFGRRSAPWLAVVEERGEWRALMPVRSGHGWHRLPLPSTATWRPSPVFSLLGTPLIAADRVEAACDTLLRGLLSEPKVFFCALEWICMDDGPFQLPALQDAASRIGATMTVVEHFERGFIARRESGDYLDASFGSKHRRRLARKRRKLAERCDGEITLTRGYSPDLVSALIDLEAKSRYAGSAHILAVSAARIDFFNEVCRRFATRDKLRMLALRGPNDVLAVSCELRSGAGIFSFKVAYNTAYAKFSPGLLLDIDAIEDFHENETAAWIDSCADPNNATVNSVWPDRRRLGTATLMRGMKGALAYPAVTAMAATRDRLTRLRSRR